MTVEGLHKILRRQCGFDFVPQLLMKGMNESTLKILVSFSSQYFFCAASFASFAKILFLLSSRDVPLVVISLGKKLDQEDATLESCGFSDGRLGQSTLMQVVL